VDPTDPVEQAAAAARAVEQIAHAVVTEAVERVNDAVKPAAAAAVATTFTFPIGLMLAVLLFLIVQSRLDRRDPKLRSEAGASQATLQFEDEDSL
jgi:hypothetical protein